jgi:hypothetical protein
MTDLTAIKIMLDFSIVLSLLILAYLSKRLGDALKIRPYYFILYAAALLIGMAGAADVTAKMFAFSFPPLVPLAVRCSAALAALGACLRYWSWLFSDIFGV